MEDQMRAVLIVIILLANAISLVSIKDVRRKIKELESINSKRK